MNNKKHPHIYNNCRARIKHKTMENIFASRINACALRLPKSRRLYANLEEQAIRDPLTGMYNRRYMESMLTPEHTQAKQGINPLSIVMLDMDNLKKLNDTFGHAVGDMALKILGEKLRANDPRRRYSLPLWRR